MKSSNSNSENFIKPIFDKKINNDFNDEAIYKLNKEVEKKMQDFEIEKKQQIANAIDLINKLVITA